MKKILALSILIIWIFIFTYNCVGQNPDKHKAEIDSIKYLFHNATHDTLKIRLLNELSSLNRKEHSDSALLYAQNATRISKKINYPKGLLKSLKMEGQALVSSGKAEYAISKYQQALSIANSLNDSISLATIANDFGVLYHKTAEYELSLKYYLEAIIINKKIKQNISLTKVLHNLGLLYIEQGKYEESIIHLNEALKIHSTIKDDQALINILNNLGTVYFYMDKVEKGLDYFLKAEKIIDKVGTTEDIITSYSNIAYIYQSMGRMEKAKAYFMKCAPLVDEEKYPMMAIAYYTNLAVYYENVGDIESAIQYYKKALPILERVQSLSDQKIIYGNLSILYQKKDNYEEAFNYYELMTEVKDSLFNERKAELISEMEEKYESDKKDQAIALHDIEMREKDLKIVISRAILVGLAIIFIAFGWGSIQRRRRLQAEAKQKAKENQQRILDMMQQQEVATLTAGMEAQENERNRIARELHDSVNTLIATVKINLNGLEEEEKLLKKEASKQLLKAQELTEIASAEVRRISHNLANPLFTDGGLWGALSHLQSAINSAQIVEVNLSGYGLEEVDIPYTIEMELFRVVQELVKNTLKHAKATKIEIEINAFPDSLALSISDNGVGFDPKTVVSSGMGMKSIAARIEKLNGNYHLDSAPGRGTETTIEIPLT